MTDMRRVLFSSVIFHILSSCYGLTEYPSSSGISLHDLRIGLDTMLINALKAHVPNSGIGNREELRLQDVISDNETIDHFPSARHWYSLSATDAVYLVGLSEQNGLEAIILNRKKAEKINETNPHAISVSKSSIVLPYKALNAAIFQRWNSITRETEVICVLALDNPTRDLKWYKFEKGKLVEFWSWSIHKVVNNLQVFTDERYVKLILVNESPSNAISMYDINLGLKLDFSLSQIIHFESGVRSVAISFVGESIYMSVPQTSADVISVFKLDTPTMLHSQFHLHENLTCKAVRDVTAFNTAYQNYLAVVGDKTMIYRIKFSGEIVEELKINLGSVAKWAPIKLATYRDDTLLLARRENSPDIHFLGWRGSDEGFSKLIGSESFCAESQIKGGLHELCSISKRDWEGATSFLLGGPDSAVPFFLVPKMDGSSSLFHFITSLNSLKSPIIWELEILQKRKDFIQDLLKEQKEKLSRLEMKMKNTLKANTTNVVSGSWKVQRISTSCLDRGENFSVDEGKLDSINNPKKDATNFSEKFQKILENYKKAVAFVKDEKLMKEAVLKSGKAVNRVTAKKITIIDSVNIETLNGLSITDILNGTYRIDRPKKIMGRTTVKTLQTDNLNLRKVQNIRSDDLIFAGDVVELEDGIKFPNDVEADNVILRNDGKVNGIDFSKDLVKVEEYNRGTFHFEDLEAESQVIGKSRNDHSKSAEIELRNSTEKRWKKVMSGRNFTVKKVNGFLWSQLIDSAIWKNKDQNIRGTLHVEGRVTVKAIMFVETDDTNVKYALEEGEWNGLEHFGNHGDRNLQSAEIVASEGHEKGDVNIENNKRIRCINKKNLLMKNLMSGKPVTGDIVFSGNVFVEKLLFTTEKNPQKWSDEVKNIILKNDSYPVVSGRKNFEQLLVKGNLDAEKNINGYDLRNFMTKDSPQEISGSKTMGEHVSFKNINLNGTWDGINLTDLYRNSIRLSSSEILEDLHLIMTDNPGNEQNSRILTPSLAITSEYKKFSEKISPRSDIDESENSLSGFDVEKISFKEIEVMGSLFVEKRIAGKNFPDFLERRISLRERDNTITGNYSSRRIEADHLRANSINGQTITELKQKIANNRVQLELEYPEMLDIGTLYVDGNIKTRNGVSGLNISKLSQTALFFNRNCGAFNGTLIFQEKILCERFSVGGLISGVNLTDFFSDAIRSNENFTTIQGKKVFEKDFYIGNNLELGILNGHNVENLLTKNSNQTLNTNLFIKKVDFSNNSDSDSLKIDGNLNGFDYNQFQKRFKYSNDGGVQWSGDIIFDDNITFDEILVSGDIIGRNFSRFMKNVFSKEKENILAASIVFENDITVLGDISITGNYNGMDFEDYVKDVVLITEKADVKGNVSFRGKVVVSRDLHVYDRLDTKTLYGCHIDEWRNNAIYIRNISKNDLPIHGRKLFHKVTSSGDVKTDTIDDVDLNKAVLLNGKQTIYDILKFSKVTVHTDVGVGHLVNGLSLQEEHKKTLMIDGDQIISSTCNFLGDFVIENNLITLKSVNGKLLQNTATLVGNQTFNDNFTFECIVAENEINTNGNLVSGINTQDWFKRAVFKDTNQHIRGDWYIRGNISFEKPLRGSGKLNGVDITDISERLNIWRKEHSTLQSEMSVNFTVECLDLMRFVDKARRQVFKLQHFELLQRIPSVESISSVHHFQTRSGSFLVVSLSSICRLLIYKWNKISLSFRKSNEQPFNGPVENWNTLKLGGKTFLITQTKKDTNKSNSKCSSSDAVSLWKFNDLFGKLEYVKELSENGEILGTHEKFLYTFKEDIASKWKLKEYLTDDWTLELLESWNRKEIGNPRFEGGFTFEVNILTKLARKNNYESTSRFWGSPSIQNEFSLHPQNKFLAVSTMDFPEIRNHTDFVMIYRENGSLFEKLSTTQPNALTWIQFSETQTLLAFMEGNNTLQIYELQGGGRGFVNILSTSLPSKNLQGMLLSFDGHWNQVPSFLTYTDHEINLISAQMAGSIYEGISPDCDIAEG